MARVTYVTIGVDVGQRVDPTAIAVVGREERQEPGPDAGRVEMEGRAPPRALHDAGRDLGQPVGNLRVRRPERQPREIARRVVPDTPLPCELLARRQGVSIGPERVKPRLDPFLPLHHGDGGRVDPLAEV